jgi:hypothetical protein
MNSAHAYERARRRVLELVDNDAVEVEVPACTKGDPRPWIPAWFLFGPTEREVES